MKLDRWHPEPVCIHLQVSNAVNQVLQKDPNFNITNVGPFNVFSVLEPVILQIDTNSKMEHSVWHKPTALVTNRGEKNRLTKTFGWTTQRCLHYGTISEQKKSHDETGQNGLPSTLLNESKSYKWLFSHNTN